MNERIDQLDATKMEGAEAAAKLTFEIDKLKKLQGLILDDCRNSYEAIIKSKDKELANKNLEIASLAKQSEELKDTE
jgi:uncharacterized protein (DUF2141 family)